MQPPRDATSAVTRRGPVVVVDGVPYGDDRTTLSLLPAAAQGQWMAANNDAFRGVLLDVGCGNAPYRRWYSSFVDRAVCVDLAPSVEVDVCGVAERLPFRDATFDTVLASEILEHVGEVDRCVGEIHRVLKPGGEVIITVPFIYPVHEAPHDHRRFTQYGLDALLLRHGFRVGEIQAKGGLLVLVLHWLVLVAVMATGKVVRGVFGRGGAWPPVPIPRAFVVPQRFLLRRNLVRATTGTAGWATLGYMVRATKLP